MTIRNQPVALPSPYLGTFLAQLWLTEREKSNPVWICSFKLLVCMWKVDVVVSACLRFCAPLEKYWIKSHFKYKFQSAVDSLTGSAPKCALLWYFLCLMPADFYSSVVEYYLPVNRLHLIQFWSGLWSWRFVDQWFIEIQYIGQV
jgi:hypothetical protein